MSEPSAKPYKGADSIMNIAKISRPRVKLLAVLIVTLLTVSVVPQMTAVGATAAHEQKPNAPTMSGAAARTDLIVMPLQTPRQADMTDRPAEPEVSINAASCWTHFAPPNPDGIALAQYYRNCNGYGLYVYAGYEINGVRYQTHECTWMSNGYYVFFWHPSTVQGAGYSTWVC